jgi:hypothetical protein
LLADDEVPAVAQFACLRPEARGLDVAAQQFAMDLVPLAFISQRGALPLIERV